MKRQKRVKSHFRIIISIAIILGLIIGLWQGFFGGETVSSEKAESLLNQDEDYCYFYSQLSEDEQSLYQKVYYTLSEFQESIKLNTQDIDVLQKVFESVIYDHPELYYVNNQFQYRLQNQSLIFIPTYDYSESEVNQNLETIEENTVDIINEALQLEESLDKVKLIYDYIIDHVEYQENEGTDQNILSSLIDGQSVCAGYARAYQYLLNRVGVEAVYIVGTVNESLAQDTTDEGHAWVMIHLDDDYYYSDLTWGDVVNGDMTHTCYGFLLMTDEEMLACYEPSVSYEKTTNTTNPYYSEIGCYMETYSQTVMNQAIQNGLNDGTRVAEIKCANDTVYQQLKQNIQTTYLGYNLLRANDCWSNKCVYSYVDELMLIELYY